MPKNVIAVDRATLSTYGAPTNTVASHKFIIEETVSQLEAKGFNIIKEEYVRNLNGEVAQGIYHLQYGTDQELGMMFSWANSYDRTMSFRCGEGAYNKVSECNVIGSMDIHRRNPNVNAEDQTKDNIKDAVFALVTTYNDLLLERDFMKTKILTDFEIGAFLGRMYINKDVLTSSQMISVKEQLKKPLYDLGVDGRSLWAMYNYVTHALKKSHPKTWMEQHMNFHTAVKETFFPAAEEVDPDQTNILDVTEAIESHPIMSESNTQLQTEECVDCDAEEVINETIANEDTGIEEADLSAGRLGEGSGSEGTTENTDVSTDTSLPHTPNNIPVSGVPDVSEGDRGTEEEGEKVEGEVISSSAEEFSQTTETSGETEGSSTEISASEEQVVEGKSLEEQLLAKGDPHDNNGHGDVDVQDGDLIPEKDEEPKTVLDEATPLEEQVASETVQPVSQEELAVSESPVVDNPHAEESKQGKLESPDFEF